MKNLTILLIIYYLCLSFLSKLYAVDFNFVRGGNHYWFAQGDVTTQRPVFVFSNDSVIQKEDEIRYVSYPYLRYNFNPTMECEFMLGDSWIGKHVTQKSDGKILFFNADGDTISLLLEVFIKSPLTAFTYSNGDILKVHGVQRKDTVLFGMKDVVDVFDLWRENSDGLIQNDPVNKMQIMVSKNLGVIAMPAFYLLDVQQFNALFGYEKFEIYHLVGVQTDSISYGLTTPTNEKIQQFAIGDEFHIDMRDGHITGPNILTGQVIYKVLSKNNSSSGDSLLYRVERCARYDQNDMDGHVYYTKHDTLNWNYELNATVGDCEDQYPYHMFNGNDYRYTMTVDVLGNVEVFINGDVLYGESDSCINQMMVNGGNYSIIKTGFPRLNFGSGSSYDQTERFVYYKKGDRTWGIPFDCDKFLSAGNLLINGEVSLFPNPCTQNANVRIQGISNVSQAVIVDLSGRVMAVQSSADELNYLETNQLKVGLYLVKLTRTNGGEVCVKLLVK